MYVMTNREKINGAAEILFPENLDKLSAKFDSDIYIIPSSVHEIIAVSAEGKDASELQEMVNEVNMNEVSLEERLSNEVYHYDRIKGNLPLHRMHLIKGSMENQNLNSFVTIRQRELYR
jgi:hypothetical protein